MRNKEYSERMVTKIVDSRISCEFLITPSNCIFHIILQKKNILNLIPFKFV